jgi:isoleucyl-tRNA synthetase
MLTGGSPWSARRIGDEVLEEVVRKVLLTYWNTASFLSLYANASEWHPSSAAPAPAPADRPLIDRWLLSELHHTVREVDDALEQFDSARAGRRLTTFIDDLSNWYIRRSRRRFWDGDPAALATLYETVEVLTRLLAPFVPFITEQVWSALAAEGAPDSVHLARWPVADESLIDQQLSTGMTLARRLVELGRSARAESKVKTRQPLPRALAAAPGFAQLPPELRAQVAEELNVVELDSLREAGELLDISVKANFRTLGKRFGKTVTIDVEGAEVELTADDMVITETPKEGWAVARDAGLSIALDLTVTPELRSAGLAREVVRFIQDARKTSGLDISDRIELWWQEAPATAVELAAAVVEHTELISAEVLATFFVHGRPEADIAPHEDVDLGLTIWLRAAGG